MEIAAPTYTQLLHTPLTVADLPTLENLPGRQEMSKKFTPCIDAQMNAVIKRAATRKKAPSIPRKNTSGIASASEIANRSALPETSFSRICFLYSTVTMLMLRIENMGKMIDTRVDEDTSLLNASD